ncbi:hypothetical protein BaRGS_00013563 [Batillaria attramentaria]|uniref:Uncharacterized protein n=1 Tax=Batillaria attramentaria TaxID=370345 RepID=A0ABD0L798_9CAEN
MLTRSSDDSYQPRPHSSTLSRVLIQHQRLSVVRDRLSDYIFSRTLCRRVIGVLMGPKEWSLGPRELSSGDKSDSGSALAAGSLVLQTVERTG